MAYSLLAARLVSPPRTRKGRGFRGVNTQNDTVDTIIDELGPYPFTGTARGCPRQNLAAHGGVKVIQVREDRARREVNVNGAEKEYGRWYFFAGHGPMGASAYYWADRNG